MHSCIWYNFKIENISSSGQSFFSDISEIMNQKLTNSFINEEKQKFAGVLINMAYN